MALRYWIDRTNGIVRSEASGQLSMEDLRAYFASTRSDPEVRPDMHRLMDLRSVDQIISSSDVRELATFSRMNAPNVGARLAIIAGSDLVFGVSKMFQGFAGYGDQLLVVRDETEAMDWLLRGRRD